MSTLTDSPAPVLRLLDLVEAYRISAPVYVATKIGIPDLLRDGPLTVAQLAVATGTDEDALCRLLRALSTLELFDELADGSLRRHRRRCAAAARRRRCGASP